MVKFIFPTPIYTDSLSEQELSNVSTDIQTYLDSGEGFKPSLFEDGGDHLLSDPTFSENVIAQYKMQHLSDVIMQHTARYLRHLNPHFLAYNSLNISTSWITYTPANKHTLPHAHNPHEISGVYYHKVPVGSGDLALHSPNNCHTTTPSIGGGDRYIVKAEQGTLVLFPSWLVHHVKTNMSDSERISVSFNLDIA
jgi:uncharacterized protein (TIGR02466 family)